MISFLAKKILNSSQGSLQLDVSFTVEQGQFLTLYGESGAGKTSILKILSGLLLPNEGQIMRNNEVWFDHATKTNKPIQQRGIAYAFQNFALFPNMTVRENLLFAGNGDSNAKLLDELIEVTSLGDLQHQKPKLLSGGQQQRVALARALAQESDLLLLDEPLSALDMDMRSHLQDYILEVHKKRECNTIMVSHDIPEIIKMSDKVLVIEDGKVSNEGNSINVFSNRESDSGSTIKGTIVKLTKQNGQTMASALIGGQIVRMPISEGNREILKVGDEVSIKVGNFKI